MQNMFRHDHVIIKLSPDSNISRYSNRVTHVHWYQLGYRRESLTHKASYSDLKSVSDPTFQYGSFLHMKNEVNDFS